MSAVTTYPKACLCLKKILSSNARPKNTKSHRQSRAAAGTHPGHEKPMSREELAKVLKLTDEEPLEALRRRLRAMERDGRLVFTRNQCYALPDRLNLVKGYVLGHKDGFGFLRPEGGGPDLSEQPRDAAPDAWRLCAGAADRNRPQGSSRKRVWFACSSP